MSSAARSSPAVAVRSLADELRSWDEERLARLLGERIDLTAPLPHDLTALAVRAASRASVQRAVDALDTATLQVLEILVVLPEPADPADVAALAGRDVTEALSRLCGLALVWGATPELRLVRTVRDLFGPYPAGLGPDLSECLTRREPERLVELGVALGVPTESVAALPALIAAHLGDAGRLADLLDGAPEGARDVLDALAWGPPVGRLNDADRPVSPAEATTSVRWLLAHGLLAVAGPDIVVLPRQIALALRGGQVHRAGSHRPPTPSTRTLARADESAAPAAVEAVRLVEALGRSWELSPPPVLRSGGLGVREVKRVAARLDIDVVEASRLIEIAYAAGLIADDGELEPRWAPTPAFDDWLAAELPRRWAHLAEAWRTTTRCPALVGSRDARDSPRNALSGDLDRAMAPGVRGWLLGTLADLGPGEAASIEELTALLDWAAPRRAGSLRTTLLEAARTEGIWLGLLSPSVPNGCALAGYARPLLDGGGDAEHAAAHSFARVLPPSVDHVLLQGDLTAVAPGRLTDTLARDLDLAADAESRGGGAVYRFSPASIRRALDAGRTGEDLLGWLRSASRTPVPQPLEYLIADTARKHGRIRVAGAQAFIRSDDEASLTELVADRRLAALRLRRLAPTVLAAQAPPETVLEVLRRAGLAPAIETDEGAVVLTRPTGYRTTPRLGRPGLARISPATPSEAVLRSAAAALRMTEHLDGRAVDPDPPEVGEPTVAADPGAMLTLLARAAEARRPVWVGYVESDGSPARRLVEPIHVDGGRVSAFDRETASVRTFPIARVTSVTAARS